MLLSFIHPLAMTPDRRPASKGSLWCQRLLAVILVTTLLASALDGRALLAAPAQRPANQITPGCIDLVEGGNFEQYSANWLTIQSPRLPSYTNEQTFNSSAQSLRLGNGLELPNVESVSEVRYKSLQLPMGATRIILRFVYYPLFEDNPGTDLQQADLFDATTDQLLLSLLNVQANDRAWRARDFDLTPFAGRTISLRFRVRNDGQLGRTLMYLDNVEIEYCAQTPIPTNTPTVTATGLVTLTPTPTGTPLTPATATPILTFTPPPLTVVPTLDPSCVNILANSGFESWDAWHFGEDPVPPVYVGDPRVEGARAVQLGNPPGYSGAVVTFSSIRQLVTLPFTVTRLELRWWKLLRTEQPGAPGQFTDRQDLILLSPSLQPIQILRRELRNDNVWVQDVVDLTPYRGQSLYIYFNAYNDSNNSRTWMYLDDVRLNLCGGVVATPYAAPAVVAQAQPLAVPLTTITPASQVAPPPVVMSATPTLTPPVLPTATATLSATATIVAPAALIEMPSPTPSPTAPTLPFTVTATAAVYALPTEPASLQVETTTDTAAAQQIAPPVVTPVSATPTVTVTTTRPLWMERLGPIVVLGGILLLIAFIVWVIIRTFRGRP